MSVWDHFMKCFKKGGKGKGCTIVKIADLYKRVPDNQKPQFKIFAKKCEEYRVRLRKYPPKLPIIDWKYYKKNVRKEYVDWVKDYQKQYDNLENIFANRHTMIDHTHYFGELVKDTEKVKEDVKKYKEESDERIKGLLHRIEKLKGVKPYTEMTMEEFCLAHPEAAPDFINKPTFWPHTPEEQQPGPTEVHVPEEEGDVTAKPTPKGDKTDPAKPDPDKPDPGKPPPTAPTAAPAGATPTDAKPKTSPEGTTKDTKPSEPAKGSASPAKVEEKTKPTETKPDKGTESQAAEQVSQIAAKGVEIAKDLAAKAITLFKSLYEKMGEKRKAIADTAKAERLKTESEHKTASTTASSAKPKKDDDDDDLQREGPSNICHKTIIRGEAEGKADVKSHHVDLDIESDDMTPCERKQAAKRKAKSDEGEDSVCERKAKCPEEDVCESKATCPEEDVCESKPKCPEEEERECIKLIQPEEDTCEHKPKCPEKEERECIKLIPSKGDDTKPREQASLVQLPKTESSSGVVIKTIIGMHQETITAAISTNFPTKDQKLQAEDIEKSSDQGKVITSNFEDQMKQKKMSPNRVLETAGLAMMDKLRQDNDKQDVKLETKPSGASRIVIKSDRNIDNNETNPNQATETITMSESKNDIVGSKKDTSDTDSDISDNISSDELAKLMFKLATGAATLLSDAKKIIEKAKVEGSGNVEGLESAYDAADQQVNRALSQAYKALSSAKKLTERAQNILDSEDKNAVALIEKHTVLAKLLAQRAITMRKEIAILLTGLKKKQ